MRTNLLFFLVITGFVARSSVADDVYKPYIVHMDTSAMPASFSTQARWYQSLLSSIGSPPERPPRLLYVYRHVIKGFSAMLSGSYLQQLQTMPAHLATHPDSYDTLHTTRTPSFLGLNKQTGLWPVGKFGNDTIIGIIDTRIWPESKSFDDKGMPPVPERWRGACEAGVEFSISNCNRKLIGARSFSKGLKEHGLNISEINDYDSLRDYAGHGTHTASTAAGSPVFGADYFGYAKGTAVGMAPMARLAIYKVSWATETFESAATDVLVGMDQAMEDGVDLMSLSLGFPQTPFFDNVIALGALAATEQGIFVSCSAGNDGPEAYTIFNGAPWITTVGASTLDRGYAASATLRGEGNDTTKVLGLSFYPESILIFDDPLYYGKGNTSKEICSSNSLDASKVAGKILFCSYNKESDAFTQIYEANRSSAKAVILVSDLGLTFRPNYFYFPAVAFGLKDGEIVKDFVTKTVNTTADIKFQITVSHQKPAPQIVYFSSRGPYSITPGLLKPDVVAPGVNVLAAWMPKRKAAVVGSYHLVSDYTLLSGTSMSSPHVVGVAALLRAVHPDWSVAAIRSALMTTAYTIDNTYGPILDMTTRIGGTPLDYGSGHIHPNKAMDPGLIYDLGVQDYIHFVCSLNYTQEQVRIITRRSDYTCTTSNFDINYPSFMVILYNNISSQTFKRVLTNVQDLPAAYHVVVEAPIWNECDCGSTSAIIRSQR
ncbi:hypothetical protein AMTR_s00017p00214530 [Amborella trichopoda]|uniref:Peptidase S8/S53 domain-containing protein n=1 Tax=Amborella trichopoda TaxID=13333 RepID=W1PKX3_AMBTC|nr:hypothetical protein AMTR_s00017p00214530 [Amborella trichopoda]